MNSQKKVLVVTIEGGGNIPPMLNLSRRLSEAGYRVSVLSEPCLKEVVEQNELHFLPFSDYFTRSNRQEDIIKDWNASLLDNPVFENLVFGPAEIVVRDTKRYLESIQADLLIADCLLFPSLIAAEALRIPRVVVFHMPEYLPGPNRPPGIMGLLPGQGTRGRWRDQLLGKVFNLILDKDLHRLNAVRAQYQLPPLAHVTDHIHGANLRLIQTLRDFDFPMEPAPANVRYTGPVLDDPDWVAPWQSPWPDSDPRPLVVVSLSTTFQNQQAVIERCIEALGKLPVRGLVTLGPSVPNASLELPENVVAVPSASHAQVFPQASVVITHAGHGTLMRALSYGVPLLCLPMGRDQNDNAAKVAYHGCGLKLSPKASADKIHKAVSRLLGESSFKRKAEILAQKILSDAQKDTALKEIESLFEPANNSHKSPIGI
mgnify:CR=1 FL=1